MNKHIRTLGGGIAFWIAMMLPVSVVAYLIVEQPVGVIRVYAIWITVLVVFGVVADYLMSGQVDDTKEVNNDRTR